MKEIQPLDQKTEFMNSFRDLFDDDLVPVEWSDEKKARVKELTSDNRLNTARVATIPLVCKGPSCPSAAICVLYKENLHPLGKSCPIEMKMIAKLMLGIMEELDIDPNSINEVGMVRDLVDQEIQQLRKQSLLAQHDVIQENVIGIDENGEPIMKKELHLAVDWEDKIHKRKANLLKMLLATRESRVKAGTQVLDQAANMASILTSFNRLRAAEDERLKKELGLDEKDDYIESQLAELEDKSKE